MITPDELTRLRLYRGEAATAAEKAEQYRAYLAKRCNHPSIVTRGHPCEVCGV